MQYIYCGPGQAERENLRAGPEISARLTPLLYTRIKCITYICTELFLFRTYSYNLFNLYNEQCFFEAIEVFWNGSRRFVRGGLFAAGLFAAYCSQYHFVRELIVRNVISSQKKVIKQ